MHWLESTYVSRCASCQRSSKRLTEQVGRRRGRARVCVYACVCVFWGVGSLEELCVPVLPQIGVV